MKFLPILALIPFFWSLVWAEKALPNSEVFFVDSVESGLEPMSPNFSRLYDILSEYSPPFDIESLGFLKREVNQATADRLAQLIVAVNQSGVVGNVLHEVALSTEQLDKISNSIYSLLTKFMTSGSSSNSSIAINITETMHIVMNSGLIQSTAHNLLKDDTQLRMFADSVGEIMVNYTWVPELVKYLGEKGKISFDTIFELARNSKSKDPGFQGANYVKRSLGKRADNSSSSSGAFSGSLLAFINNLLGSALSSELASTSLETILAAVNQSNVVVPTIQAAAGDPVLLKAVGHIANNLYNYGVFDYIDINSYYQKMRKDGTLTRGAQQVFTDPVWSPPIGKILEQLENTGVFAQIQRNLYGSTQYPHNITSNK